MKYPALTLSILFEGGSANYGEGFGNITTLKKLTRDGGKTYSYISRQALRYSLVNLLKWDDTPIKTEGSGDKTVVQFSPETTIKTSPEIDLFGYMKTTKGDNATTRSAVARLSHAIALEPYRGELDFLTNMGLAKRKEGTGNNIAQSEIHQSLYGYTITIDLDRVGIDGNIEITQKEKAERVCHLLEGICYLYRDIKGRRENLAPVFAIGGVYARKNPYFEGRVKVEKNAIDLDLLLSTMAGNQDLADNTLCGVVAGMFENEKNIKSDLHAEHVGDMFNALKKAVVKAYEG